MKIDEITRTTTLISAGNKFKIPNNTIFFKKIDQQDIFYADYSNYDSYFTKNDEDYITAFILLRKNNEMFRMENISKEPGLVTIILYAILDNDKEIIINPNEDLTKDGFNWLKNALNKKQYFAIADINNNPINERELYLDWLNDKGKIGIKIKATKKLTEEILKNQVNDAPLGLVRPMIKWVGNKDLL